MTRNAGRNWSADDEAELERLISEEKCSDLECSERMGRSVHAIETKRQFFGLRPNSKTGHSRPRVRAYHRADTIERPAIHADPAMERKRLKETNVQHVLDVGQMFGTTRETVISEYKRRCEYTVTPDQATPTLIGQTWFEGSACSSSAGWLE